MPTIQIISIYLVNYRKLRAPQTCQQQLGHNYLFLHIFYYIDMMIIMARMHPVSCYFFVLKCAHILKVKTKEIKTLDNCFCSKTLPIYFFYSATTLILFNLHLMNSHFLFHSLFIHINSRRLTQEDREGLLLLYIHICFYLYTILCIIIIIYISNT